MADIKEHKKEIVYIEDEMNPRYKNRTVMSDTSLTDITKTLDQCVTIVNHLKRYHRNKPARMFIKEIDSVMAELKETRMRFAAMDWVV